MVRPCSAIVRSTGFPCTCRVNDTGIFCGRHGGLSQNSARRINRDFPVNICSAIVRSTGLRCTCPVVSRGGAVCGRHIGYTMTRNSLVEAFEDLGIKEVEMDYISKFYCCICIEDVDSENAGYQMSCCKKGFCVGCINEWVKTSTSCPHCRAEIK